MFSFTAGENFDNDNKGVSNEDEESGQSNIQQGDRTDRNLENVSNEDKESGQSDIQQGNGATERNLEDVPNEKKKNQTDMVSDKSSTSDEGAENEQDSSQNDNDKGECFDSHDNDEDQAIADGNKLAGDKFQSEKSNVPQRDGSGSNSSHNQRQFTVYINEGERYQIEKWVERFPNIETGGDLFGAWIDDRTAVVQFVLGPGENCHRTGASFFQDIDYLRKAGTYLTEKHGLCNIGQWHSHHRLGLTRPSGGDKNTVWGNMPNLGLDRYIVFIATIAGSSGSSYSYSYGNYSHEEELTVNINPYLFEIKDGRRKGVLHGSFEFMKRNSPFRLDEGIGNKVEIGAEDTNDVEIYENVDVSNKGEESMHPSIQQDGTDKNPGDVSNEENKLITPSSREEKCKENQTDMVGDRSVTSDERAENEQDSSQDNLAKGGNLFNPNNDKDHAITDDNKLAGDSQSKQSSASNGDGSDSYQQEGDWNKKREPTTPTTDEDERKEKQTELMDVDNKQLLTSGIQKDDEEDSSTNNSVGQDDDNKGQVKTDNGTAFAGEGSLDGRSEQSNIPKVDGTGSNLQETSQKSTVENFDKHDSDKDQLQSDAALLGDVIRDEQPNVSQKDAASSLRGDLNENSKPVTSQEDENEKQIHIMDVDSHQRSTSDAQEEHQINPAGKDVSDHDEKDQIKVDNGYQDGQRGEPDIPQKDAESDLKQSLDEDSPNNSLTNQSKDFNKTTTVSEDVEGRAANDKDKTCKHDGEFDGTNNADEEMRSESEEGQNATESGNVTTENSGLEGRHDKPDEEEEQIALNGKIGGLEGSDEMPSESDKNVKERSSMTKDMEDQDANVILHVSKPADGPDETQVESMEVDNQNFSSEVVTDVVKDLSMEEDTENQNAKMIFKHEGEPDDVKVEKMVVDSEHLSSGNSETNVDRNTLEEDSVLAHFDDDGIQLKDTETEIALPRNTEKEDGCMKKDEGATSKDKMRGSGDVEDFSELLTKSESDTVTSASVDHEDGGDHERATENLDIAPEQNISKTVKDGENLECGIDTSTSVSLDDGDAGREHVTNNLAIESEQLLAKAARDGESLEDGINDQHNEREQKETGDKCTAIGSDVQTQGNDNNEHKLMNGLAGDKLSDKTAFLDTANQGMDDSNTNQETQDTVKGRKKEEIADVSNNDPTHGKRLDKRNSKQSRSIFERPPEYESTSNDEESEADKKVGSKAITRAFAEKETKNEKKESPDNKQDLSERKSEAEKNEFDKTAAFESIDSDIGKNSEIFNENPNDGPSASEVNEDKEEAVDVQGEEGTESKSKEVNDTEKEKKRKIFRKKKKNSKLESSNDNGENVGKKKKSKKRKSISRKIKFWKSKKQKKKESTDSDHDKNSEIVNENPNDDPSAFEINVGKKEAADLDRIESVQGEEGTESKSKEVNNTEKKKKRKGFPWKIFKKKRNSKLESSSDNGENVGQKNKSKKRKAISRKNKFWKPKKQKKKESTEDEAGDEENGKGKSKDTIQTEDLSTRENPDDLSNSKESKKSKKKSKGIKVSELEERDSDTEENKKMAKKGKKKEKKSKSKGIKVSELEEKRDLDTDENKKMAKKGKKKEKKSKRQTKKGKKKGEEERKE